MSEPAKLRAGLYGRVSIDAREGRSVDSQLDVGRLWAAAQGHVVVAEYRDDGISAAQRNKVRPDWQRVMVDIIERKLDLLWVWEISRASRDRTVWAALIAACQDAHVLLATDAKVHDPRDPDDGFMLDLTAALAVRESGQIGKRVRRHTSAAADAGRPFGAVPFGYRRTYDPASGELSGQVVDEPTATVVREIAARVLEGEPLHRIAVDLNRRAVPTPQMQRDLRSGLDGAVRGGWNNPKLRRLLTSPTIAGYRVHRGVVHGPAGWPAIVSDADHALIGRILGDPTRRTQRGTEPRHLLSGIAECGACGAWLRWLSNRGHPSYGCAGRDNTNPGHVVRRAAPLEAIAVAAVLERLKTSWLLDAVDQQGDVEATQAVRELDGLETRLAQCEAAVVAGEMSAAAFGRIEARLAAQLADARSRAVPAWLPTAVREMAGPDAPRRWETADLGTQRQVLRAVLRIVVHKPVRPSNRFDPTTVQVIYGS